MDSITRIKQYISTNFPNWKKVDFSEIDKNVDFRKDWSELYRIENNEIILISYTNISITGTDRPKPQLRVFLDEYKKPFHYAKSHQLRYYLFSIFTKEDEMARGLDNFNPKEYIISIETNLDVEGSRRDLRSIYDYANENLNGKKFLKCSRANYRADINQASFIYIGSIASPDKEMFENFINIFDSRPYLNSTHNESTSIISIESFPCVDNPYRPYITAIKSKPFLLLAGISGTGKSRIVRELARACWDEGSEEFNKQKPKNFEMIQVKPNWHDSTELFGYVSRISGKPEFVVGDFLKFIAKAWENKDVPYFLCLDEMNLAPVEQYFAEYLSVIESRKCNEDGIITTDAIFKKVEEEWYFNLTAQLTSDETIRRQFNEIGITLPQNLIVVGTVNMDETTFSFSRKVLDRAMTIEMNEVDLKGGLESRYEAIGKLGYDELIGTCVEGVDVYKVYPEVCDKVIAYLQTLNDKLEGTPFKVAYRTRNEFLLYVVNNLPYNKDQDGNDIPQDKVIQRALDEITSMKILSRIEGDETKVSVNFLTSLEDIIKNSLQEIEIADSVSLKKLDEMKKRLDSGYTSFWS